MHFMVLNMIVLLSVDPFITLSVKGQDSQLERLVQVAETNYPMIKSRRMEIEAARKGVDATNAAYRPSLDAAYQLDYATFNNITGMAYPQYLVPISGPPSSGNAYEGVFGSAASLVFNWQAVTFGQRDAQAGAAAAMVSLKQADAIQGIFLHKLEVISTYIDLLTSAQVEKLRRLNIERATTSLQSTYPLVTSGMRPGVDSAMLRAEVSKARVELINSRKQKEQYRIYLSQLLATDSVIGLDDTLFFSRLPVPGISSDSLIHPMINSYKATLAHSEAKKKILSKTTLPTLGVWATAYARGSGISYTGDIKSTDGLGFQRYNYGVGVQLSMPLLQTLKIKAQVQQQDYLIESTQEKLNETNLLLKKQQETSELIFINALEAAGESPVLLESAQYAYRAMASRYESGLTDISNLLQAQYTLIRAETDHKLAYAAAWKALLRKAAARGDLAIFYNQLK
jgi:outer membrane protein TolC